MNLAKLPLSRAWWCAFGSLAIGGARAQGDGSTVDCIPVRNIDHTEVIDNRSILFHMRGRHVFLNDLERDCPGLGREKRFMYEVRTGQLCSTDTISVLENWGVGLARGFTCPLGPFYKVSEDQVEDLRAKAQRLTDEPTLTNERRKRH